MSRYTHSRELRHIERHPLLRAMSEAARVVQSMDRHVSGNMARHWYLSGYVDASRNALLRECLETAWGY